MGTFSGITKVIKISDLIKTDSTSSGVSRCFLLYFFIPQVPAFGRGTSVELALWEADGLRGLGRDGPLLWVPGR